MDEQVVSRCGGFYLWEVVINTTEVTSKDLDITCAQLIKQQ